MEYFIYTTEGTTFSPSCDGPESDIENCQVLGIEEADTPDEAVKRMLEHFPELLDLGFENVIVVPIGERSYICLQDALDSMKEVM